MNEATDDEAAEPAEDQDRGIRLGEGTMICQSAPCATLAAGTDPSMSLERRLVQAAETLPAVHLLVLFGSKARGTDAGRSDVDIAVLLDDGSAAARQMVEVALGRAAGRAVDLVDLETAPPQLRVEIARDGKLLVERRPHAWADFRAHAMIDWWDWAPTARMIHKAATRRLREQVGHGPS